ncbi:hypothetical protein TUM20983_53730 [Mycobacterium antarcticum]|nr:hypothetical protein TUM20983_53730 [Mycolicibacterium sp. TUM20983]
MPACGPNGAPAVRDIAQIATAQTLAAIPAASTGVVGLASTIRAQINWNTAIETKNSPEGSHSCQCVGTTAKWMTPAPREAIAARRPASLLSDLVARLDGTRPMMTVLALDWNS